MATQREVKVENTDEGFGAGDQIIAYGDSAFSESDISVELTLPFEHLHACVLTIRDATPTHYDILSHDGILTSQNLTVYRTNGTTSGLTFDYIAIGAPKLTTS